MGKGKDGKKKDAALKGRRYGKRGADKKIEGATAVRLAAPSN